MTNTCKSSSECEDTKVCDKGFCRENKRDKPMEYYIELCKKKNIPLTYEIGKKKDKPKSIEALKRCVNQKSRAASPVSLKKHHPLAASAPGKLSLPIPCKKSQDCPGDNICEKKKCRPDKRIKDIEYYIELCKSKGIPVRYENGEKKGQIKTVEALKRCVKQKKRSKAALVKAKSI